MCIPESVTPTVLFPSIKPARAHFVFNAFTANSFADQNSLEMKDPYMQVQHYDNSQYNQSYKWYIFSFFTHKWSIHPYKLVLNAGNTRLAGQSNSSWCFSNGKYLGIFFTIPDRELHCAFYANYWTKLIDTFKQSRWKQNYLAYLMHFSFLHLTSIFTLQGT